MPFFRYKRNLYPLIAIASALFIMVFGLVMARTVVCSYFLLGAFVWVILFGCYKQALKALPLFIVFGGAFALIAFFSSEKNFDGALAMAIIALGRFFWLSYRVRAYKRLL